MKFVTENVILTGLDRNDGPLVTVTVETPGGVSTMKGTMSVAWGFVSSVLAASPFARTSCKECWPGERAVNWNDEFVAHTTFAARIPFDGSD